MQPPRPTRQAARRRRIGRPSRREDWPRPAGRRRGREPRASASAPTAASAPSGLDGRRRRRCDDVDERQQHDAERQRADGAAPRRSADPAHVRRPPRPRRALAQLQRPVGELGDERRARRRRPAPARRALAPRTRAAAPYSAPRSDERQRDRRPDGASARPAASSGKCRGRGDAALARATAVLAASASQAPIAAASATARERRRSDAREPGVAPECPHPLQRGLERAFVAPASRRRRRARS